MIPRPGSGQAPQISDLALVTDDPRRISIVAEARRWLGTPFHHQASLRGAGCDCAGLVRGVGEACGLLDLSAEQWAAFARYGRQPHPGRMRAALERFLVPVAIDAVEVGDVAWMEWRADLPMHLGILGQASGGPGTWRLTLIHALSDFEEVVEHGFTQEWRGRVTSWWRFPGLCGER